MLPAGLPVLPLALMAGGAVTMDEPPASLPSLPASAGLPVNDKVLARRLVTSDEIRGGMLMSLGTSAFLSAAVLVWLTTIVEAGLVVEPPSEDLFRLVDY